MDSLITGINEVSNPGTRHQTHHTLNTKHLSDIFLVWHYFPFRIGAAHTSGTKIQMDKCCQNPFDQFIWTLYSN